MDIFGYLNKYGKLSFEEKPFCETDSLVFSQLSYLKFEYGFSALAAGDEYVELTRFAHLSDKTLLAHGTSDPVRYNEFWLKILECPRFSSSKIGHIESHFSVDDCIQYMSMTFIGKSPMRYIVFRGTDGSLVGWKEDCNLATMKEIPSQKLAKNYVTKIVRHHLFPFVIIGHSKGGNLAMYATLMMKWRYYARFRGCYCHDGPGFNDTKVFSQRALTRLTPKIYKVVPGESLIGLLLNQVCSYRVISANEKASFFQHSIFKWDLDEETGELIELERNSNASKTKQTMFANWLGSLSREDLVQMTECLFEILQAKDRKTIYEVMALGKLDLGITLIKSWMKYDEATRKNLKKNLFSAFTYYKEAKEEIAASYGPKKEKKPKKKGFSLFKRKK
jgi:hypothetical protein